MISLETRVQAAASSTSARIDGDVVLLDLASSQYFGLSAVGASVWEHIAEQEARVGQLKERLLSTYDVDPKRLERDLIALLSELHARGLVVVDQEIDELPAADQAEEAGRERALSTAIAAYRKQREGGRREGWRRLARAPGDWWMLVRAVGLTVAIRAALAVWTFSDVSKALRRLAEGLPRRGEATFAYQQRARWAANAAGHRILPKRPCLTQALVLQYLLLRRGDAKAQLHIGVAKGEDGGLLAHAWIEREGRVLIGGTSSPSAYQRLYREDEKAKTTRGIV